MCFIIHYNMKKNFSLIYYLFLLNFIFVLINYLSLICFKKKQYMSNIQGIRNLKEMIQY